MKIILCVLIAIVSFLYLSSLNKSSETFKYLTTGTIDIEGLEISNKETSTQFYFFLYIIFIINISIWLGAYYLHYKNLAMTGASLSFLDFIANNEIYGYLKVKTFSEKTANKIIKLFYIIVVAMLTCLLLLFVNLI
ncbi:MAG: hypothetical protein COB02_14010 [Candidatus Cloacimonadota bacterium]|nr:MAG: hypothetical protein COB02_14010 [Candidatus Cloacimonadota bacterium]